MREIRLEYVHHAVTTHAIATRATWLLKYSRLQIFEQKRHCSQSIVCKELILTCNRARVRKSCYPLILGLRHHFSIVPFRRSKLLNVYSLLYDDIYSSLSICSALWDNYAYFLPTYWSAVTFKRSYSNANQQ